MHMETIIAYGIALGIAGISLAVYYYYSYQQACKVRAKIASEYGQRPAWSLDERDYNSMQRYYRLMPSPGSEIDDITWTDLNMDAIFKRFKNAQSSVGDEYIYRFFRGQHNPDLAHFETSVQAMHDIPQERARLQYAFHRIGRKTGNRLIDLIIDPDKFPKIPFLAIMLVSLLDVAGLVLMGFDMGYGVMAVVLGFCAALCFFYYTMKKVYLEMDTLEMFVRTVKAAKLFVKMDIPAFRSETDGIKKDLKIFENVNSMVDVVVHASAIGPSGGGGSIVTVMVAYFGLYAVAYRALVHLFAKYQKQILQLYETVGYLELCISTASYRASLDYYCRPTFHEKTQIDFEGIVHPLLKQPVANTHVIGNKILVTGSNASGKSTFARTLAVNAVLGQLFNTCLAIKYAFQPCAVVTSMNLKDDILTGDSFYVAEVKSLKRMIQKAAAPEYTMLFLDEIFKGTNVVERIAAASVIMKRLSEYSCFVCLTTHDLELCGVLGSRYENYHFQEHITDDDILFDYKLWEGMTTGSNAIKMLAYCNYEPDIVAQAERFADRYRQSGVWGHI